MRRNASSHDLDPACSTAVDSTTTGRVLVVDGARVRAGEGLRLAKHLSTPGNGNQRGGELLGAAHHAVHHIWRTLR